MTNRLGGPWLLVEGLDRGRTAEFTFGNPGVGKPVAHGEHQRSDENTDEPRMRQVLRSHLQI